MANLLLASTAEAVKPEVISASQLNVLLIYIRKGHAKKCKIQVSGLSKRIYLC